MATNEPQVVTATPGSNFRSLFFRTMTGLRAETHKKIVATIEACGGVYGYSDPEEGKETFYFYASDDQLREIMHRLPDVMK